MKKYNEWIILGSDGKPARSTKRTPTKNHSGSRKNLLDIKTLVRSIQRADGQEDCFLSGRVECDWADCPWRPYCLEKTPKFQKGNF